MNFTHLADRCDVSFVVNHWVFVPLCVQLCGIPGQELLFSFFSISVRKRSSLSDFAPPPSVLFSLQLHLFDEMGLQSPL